MKVNHYTQVPSQPVEADGSAGCTVRHLIAARDGAPNFAMTQLALAPGGHTPRHSRPFEHEVFILEGEGEVFEGDVCHEIKAGDVIFIRPDEVHQFRNTGASPLTFLCLVPHTANGR